MTAIARPNPQFRCLHSQSVDVLASRTGVSSHSLRSRIQGVTSGTLHQNVVVSVDSDSFRAAAERALEAGEWSVARSSFEAALKLEETPEALVGLGNALLWLDEAEASLRYRERAYAAFRNRPDPFHAAATALQLAAHYGGNLGDGPAARGWAARAARLIEEFQLAPLEGWVLLSRAAGASSGGNP